MRKSWWTGLRRPGLALASLALLVAGCDRAAENKSLRYAEFKVSFSAASHIALTSGSIAAQKLDFTPISVAAGPDVVAALRSSSASGADAGNLANEPVAAMIGAGSEPIILATVLSSAEDVKMVTFERNGITADPRTLKGKTVGVVLDTVGESYLVELLKRGGLTVSDVRLVNARPTELQSALVRGDLDAAVLWDPFITQAPRIYEAQRKSGAVRDRGAARVLLDKSLFTSRIHVVTTREHLADHRANLVKMLRALIASEAYVASNRAAAQREVETWLGLQSGDLGEFFRSTSFRVHIDRAGTEAALGAVLTRLRHKQPSTRIPTSFDPYFDPSLLREVDPSRVG